MKQFLTFTSTFHYFYFSSLYITTEGLASSDVSLAAGVEANLPKLRTIIKTSLVGLSSSVRKTSEPDPGSIYFRATLIGNGYGGFMNFLSQIRLK